MAINLEKKSNRLLGNRRFTSADLNTAQEAFTNVLDIGADEIYTEAHLIPSSNLPFSGSTQSGETSGVLKYYFRQRLTRSNVANDVFFFMVPTGSTGGVTPQLIQDGQQTNFISPKYSLSSLANANTEDSTPGYGVKVFKSTSTDSGSLSSGDIVSVNDYQFDYKTGVIQFDSALASNLEVYMSAYQYVGKTLRTGLFVSGSIVLQDNGVTFNTSGSGAATGLQVTGSNFEFRANNPDNLFTLKNTSDEISVQIDDKVIVLGESTTTPTAVKGGMYYSGSAWFLGYENSPT
tara:strand:- start:14 stop:886 length:873 start_codon:yes stop_codon:yes gene_type:complete